MYPYHIFRKNDLAEYNKKKLDQKKYGEILKKQIEEKKEREKKRDLDPQPGKDIFKTKPENGPLPRIDYSKRKYQVYYPEENIPYINERKMDFGYINEVNYIRHKIKFIQADIKREQNKNIQLEYELQKHLKEKKNLEKELNQQRNKNIDLVNELESELNKNKQLEKELEKNIKNVQDQTLENECQEIYYKIKYLQKNMKKKLI